MPFQPTQFGRFGDLSTQYFSSIVDPDLCAAHLVAVDGQLSSKRPSLEVVMSSKGLLNPNSSLDKLWLEKFEVLCRSYEENGGKQLFSYCTKDWSGTSPGFCLHEYAAPINYSGLRVFNVEGNHKTVRFKPDGFLEVARDLLPVLNFVVTSRGDILIGSEDYQWIKHSSLAGGMKVWSAGQVGLENGMIRLIDLLSGHYVGDKRHPEGVIKGSGQEKILMSFTKAVFVEYCNLFQVEILHTNFNCVRDNEAS